MARNYKTRPIKTVVAKVQYVDDPEEVGRKLAVKPDTLWWLLANHHIAQHEYFAGRYLQGVYLGSQINPPMCLLRKGPGFSIGGGYQDNQEYPSEYAFWCLKQQAKIKRRLSLRGFMILQKMLCEYYADDQKMTNGYRRCLQQNRVEINRAFGELAWAIGYTTEHPRDRETSELRGNQKIFSRESARVLSGGVGETFKRSNAPMFGYEANLRFGNRTAI